MASLQYMALPDGPRRATVVFIHGLGGHGYNTWRRSVADQPWPIWLAEDLKGIAVATIAYEASSSNWTGRSLSLEERAKSIFPLLRSAFPDDGTPVIFVCHSLGGLVLKQLIVMAAGRLTFGPDGLALLARIGGVAFYATPHGGSHYGDLADQLRFLVWPSPTMQCLSQGGGQVHILNEQYRNWAASDPSVRHLILYETQRTIYGWIVRSRDADPGIPNAEMQPGEADHFKICKPPNRSDARYTLCRDLVASISHNGSGSDPTAPNHPIISNPLPALPRPEPILIPHIVLRALILLLVCYVGYRGIVSVYEDPFTLGIERRLEASGAPPEESRQIAARIAKDLKERKIGQETFEHFLDRGDLQVTSDPAVIYKNFLTLANKYSELEARLQKLSETTDPDVKSVSEKARSALRQGDIQTAEDLAKSLELQRKLEGQVQFRRTNTGSLVEFVNGWDQSNIAAVDVPQLAGIGVTSVKFYAPAAKQLTAALDELQKAGLISEIHAWCGAYVPRLITASSSRLSNHAFGTSFDINCNELPQGKAVQLADRPKFAEMINIFRKHGFFWGGFFGMPDPMHFQVFRIDP